MIDIQLIRDDPERIKRAAEHKNISVNIDKLLELDRQRRELSTEIDKLRAERNDIAAKMKNGKPNPGLISKGKQLKVEITESEANLEPISQQFSEILSSVPNVFSDDTPIGGEDASQSVEKWGKAEKRSIKDHLDWLEERDLVDFERGAKVAGSKFYYSKGALAQLEMALTQFALDKVTSKGFTQMFVPNMVKEEALSGTGFAPRGDERQIYSIDGEDLNLIATAEIPLTAYHKDEILDLSALPLLYVGWSPCYRMEAGAYGRHSRGIYRVHQFYKVEMYVFCHPSESEQWHEKLLNIEEEIVRDLEVPYQKLAIASGDLGAPAFKKYDYEYWSPYDGEYHELMSCSNVTDYQARRQNIRYRDENSKTNYVHTLNGTAMVSSRGPIAIIENFQDEDGNVRVPKVLQKYMNGKEIL